MKLHRPVVMSGLAVMLFTGCRETASEPTLSALSTSPTVIVDVPPAVPSLSGKSASSVSSPDKAATATASPPPSLGKEPGPPATIRLVSEPRLISPITTWVSANSETYEIRFKESMDRKSVESAVQSHVLQGIDSNIGRVSLRFAWRDDTQVSVAAEPEKAPAADLPSSSGYVIDVSGARAASGTTLQDVPAFRALVPKPIQLWRVSLDGSRKEKLTAFAEPYMLSLTENDRCFAFARRPTKYCECDAMYDLLTSVYDIETGKLESYPVNVTESYWGPGHFFADKRGFFYPYVEEPITLPKGDGYDIRIDDFVFGTGVSRDGRYVLIAAGQEGQDKDLDLVIYDGEKHAYNRFYGALKGFVPESMVSSAKVPVTFMDEGGAVYFSMIRHEPYGEINYHYLWKAGKVENWTPPTAASEWSGFIPSGDGAYRYYWNGGGLYHGEHAVSDAPLSSQVYWIGGTHSYVYLQVGPEPSSHNNAISIYDVNTRKSRAVMTLPLPYANVIGISTDSKWIYIASPDDWS